MLSQFEPVLYKLRDLMSAKVPGFYYESQLTKSPPPSEKDYFLIEDILKQKKIKGENYYFVKYLYFPKKVLILYISSTQYMLKGVVLA